MEIEKSNNGQQNIVVLNNERSYLKSISLGIKFAMDHFGDLTKCMWPFFLLTILLPFPGILFFKGQRDALLRRWIKLGYLPSVGPKALLSELFPRVVRAFFSFLIILVCCIACYFALILPTMYGKNTWYGLMAFGVLALISIPFDFCIWRLSWSDNSILKCLGSYLDGVRHYGKLFSFLLLNTILYTFVSLIAVLPLFAASLTQMEVSNARAMGELALLPASFYVMLVLAYIVFMVIMLFCDLFYSFSACLCWGSIEEVPTNSEVETSGVDRVVG